MMATRLSETGVDAASVAAKRLREIFGERASATTPAPTPTPPIGASALRRSPSPAWLWSPPVVSQQ